MACYALGLYVNKDGSYGDAVDLKNPDKPRIIEIKGSSAESLTAQNSFSPSEKFDELVFVRLEKYDDLLKIYRTGLNSQDISKIKVNSKQTVADQQSEGRRPRFSIQKEIIEPMNLKPTVLFYIREKKIEKLK